MGELTTAAIALGSNVGDREQHLTDAVASLSAFVSNVHLSRFFETEPVDMALKISIGLFAGLRNST